MVSSFEQFKRQQEQNASQSNANRLSIRPQSWSVSLKQNSQDGTTNINFNLRNVPNAKEDYKNVNVDSFEMVVLTAMQIANGNAQGLGFSRITSNVTNKGLFNVRGVDEDNTSHPLGLYRAQKLRDAQAWSQLRLFGILRAVNDAAPSKLPEINEYYGNNPIPVVMDLTFDKQNVLMDAVHAANHYQFEALIGQSIKVTAGKNQKLTAKHHGRTYYLPIFSIKKLTEEEENKMDQYAANPIKELLHFNDDVNKQDDLYQEILDAGISGKPAGELVNQLGEAGVTVDTLPKYVAEHGGWANLGGTTATPSVTPTAAPTATPTAAPTAAPQTSTPSPAPQPAASEAPAENTDSTEENKPLADDELPF